MQSLPFVIAVIVLFNFQSTVGYKSLAPQKSLLKSKIRLHSTTPNSKESIDLTGYTLSCRFDGFGVVNMTALINLKEKSEVSFSGGIQSLKPGFWRIVKYDDGRETVEATMPVYPDYCIFFDIWETSILWRGTLDVSTKRVTDGEVLTNKKRFGLIPYVETLATFTADLLSPQDELPVIAVPRLGDQEFMPPADFDSPYDMRNYPQYFDPEFVDWWFAREEAIAKGETPPPRPRPFFNPRADAKEPKIEANEFGSSDVTGKSLRQRGKATGTGNAFGKKK